MSNKSILTKREFESLLSQIREHMSNNDLAPVLLMKTTTGERFAYNLPEMPGTPEEKRRFFMTIGAAFRQDGTVAHEAIFVCEAWMVKADKPAPLEMLPSEHPERQEAVVVVGRDADNTRSAYMVQAFSRQEDGDPIWQPVMLDMNKQAATGLLDWFFAGQGYKEVS